MFYPQLEILRHMCFLCVRNYPMQLRLCFFVRLAYDFIRQHTEIAEHLMDEQPLMGTSSNIYLYIYYDTISVYRHLLIVKQVAN